MTDVSMLPYNASAAVAAASGSAAPGAYNPGAMVPANGASSALVPAADAPKYQGYASVPQVVLSAGERGARELIRRKLARGFPEFRRWWAASYQDAVCNWQLRPPGFTRPKTAADPLLPNPNLRFTGEWAPNSYGTEAFRFAVSALNTAHIRQPGCPDEPGMRPLRVKFMPQIFERASIGPIPGLYFQTVLVKGMPIGSAAGGFARPWTHVAQRGYDMDAGFEEEIEFTRTMEEEIIAWLVLQGENCVVPQIRFALTPEEDAETGETITRMTPAKAYLHFLAYARKKHPMIEYPPVRKQKTIEGISKWVDEKGTESPYAPQIQYEAQMCTGKLIPKDQRAASLAAVNYNYKKRMTASEAHNFFKSKWDNKFVRVSATRPEVRLAANGTARLVDVEISDDDCLCHIGGNTLGSLTVYYKFKPNKSQNEDKRDTLFDWGGTLQTVQVLGQCTEYGLPGYAQGPASAPVEAVIAVDEDLTEVAKSMAVQSHQPSSVDLFEEDNTITTAEEYDEFIKRALESRGLAGASAANTPAQQRLSIAAAPPAALSPSAPPPTPTHASAAAAVLAAVEAKVAASPVRKAPKRAVPVEVDEADAADAAAVTGDVEEVADEDDSGEPNAVMDAMGGAFDEQGSDSLWGAQPEPEPAAAAVAMAATAPPKKHAAPAVGAATPAKPVKRARPAH